MRIESIDCMKVYVPWKATLAEPMRRWRALSGTTPEEEDAYVIVRVRTDDGLVGLGEGGAPSPPYARRVRPTSAGTRWSSPCST